MRDWILQQIYHKEKKRNELNDDLKVLKKMSAHFKKLCCKDCDGKGKTKDYYEFPDFNFVKCPTCNGTGKPKKEARE